MKAVKYKIRISNGVIAHVHGMLYKIDEVAIPTLNLIVNKEGIHYVEDIERRISHHSGGVRDFKLNKRKIVDYLKQFSELKKNEETIIHEILVM
jgi:queuine/archaeosine tRNA-ribosyltransferase